VAKRLFSCKLYDKGIFDTGECNPSFMADSNWLQFQLRWVNHYRAWQLQDAILKRNEFLYTLLYTLALEA
jgi:hypothetical protein